MSGASLLNQDQETVWTTLAVLLRPQGRKGELLADLHIDPAAFDPPLKAFLAPPEFAGSASAARPTEILSTWLPSGRNQGRIVLQLAQISSITEAECLAGLAVLIPRAERPRLDEGAEYIEDLIGCRIFDGDALIGTLESIEFSTTPEGKRLLDVAPLLTVVTTAGDEVLIPYVLPFVRSVDILARCVTMKLPEGLLEINLPGPRP